MKVPELAYFILGIATDYGQNGRRIGVLYMAEAR
jgi:hypothetical protein